MAGWRFELPTTWQYMSRGMASHMAWIVNSPLFCSAIFFIAALSSWVYTVKPNLDLELPSSRYGSVASSPCRILAKWIGLQSWPRNELRELWPEQESPD